MEREGVQLAAVVHRRSDGDIEFPFAVPAIATLERLELTTSVTLFVGENGTGKSTLLEALAIAARLPAVGAEGPAADPTLAAQKRLADRLRLSWTQRDHRGFFLRAEDFFGFQKRIARERSEHEKEIRRIDEDLADASPYARGLAKGPHASSLMEHERRYGSQPDAASHGEAFLKLFVQRLVPGGLYLLDEPEAALSPQSQLGLLAMIKGAIDAGSQFVIATHSPILMATPGATIVSFDATPVRAVSFEELESVALVRDFLLAPERYLRAIWTDGG